jgi:hypothetical protein
LNTRLVLPQPLEAPLRDLKAQELDVLQLAINFSHLETVLNKSPTTDLESVQILLRLLKGNYLQPE